MYGDQFGEFVCGYRGLKGYVLAKSHHYDLLTNLQSLGKMYLLEHTSGSQLKKGA